MIRYEHDGLRPSLGCCALSGLVLTQFVEFFDKADGFIL